eukprot:CAMPEP_0170075640 /NCGR_PEP_ID=MMETSP0019_2-20121128/12747_1 /TAXON_ID=98059 /ORGANISM="Dinobryon sp., Strain UTEXLB2267" /LENGTH=932 /DNA_ID=CAMNT_0010286751 /DNA_START=635 /DNA_END=3433 /DNA_ORIENTATION=+
MGLMKIPIRDKSGLESKGLKLSQALLKAVLLQLQAVATTRSFQGQVISNSLWGLHSIGIRWNRLPPSIRTALYGAISRECFRMSPQSVGNSLYALGSMGLRAAALPDQMLIALELAIRKSAPSMRHDDVIQVLQGLALLRVHWSQHLSSHTRQALSIAVYSKAVKWAGMDAAGDPQSAVEVATLVHSLSRLSVRWEDLGPVFRTAILLGVRAVTSTQMGPREASREGLMVEREEEDGQEWTGGERDGEEVLASELERLDGLVFALGRNQSSDLAFDRQLQRQLRLRHRGLRGTATAPATEASYSNEDGAEEELAPGMASEKASFARSVSAVLHGLVSLRFDPARPFCFTYQADKEEFAQLQRQFPLQEQLIQEALLQSLLQYCPYMSLQGLALSLYSLSCLGLHWHRDLSSDLRAALLPALARSLKNTPRGDVSKDCQVVANVVCAFHRMHVPWTSLPADLRASLEAETLRLLGEAIPLDELALLLSSMANVAKRHDSFFHSQRFRRAVAVGLARSITAARRQDVQAKSVYVLLNALGKLGLEEGFLRAFSVVSQRVDSAYGVDSIYGSESGNLWLSSGTVELDGVQYHTSQWLHVDQHVDNTRRPGSFSRAAYQVLFQPHSSEDWWLEERPRVARSLLTEPLLSSLYKLVLLADPHGMNLQGSMMCLQALAKMQVRWIHIPGHVRRVLLSAIIREAHSSASPIEDAQEWQEGQGPLRQGQSQAIAIIVHSLGKLNSKWSELEMDFYSDTSLEDQEQCGLQDALLRLLSAQLPAMDCQNLANLLSGLRDMAVPWSHSEGEQRGFLKVAALPGTIQRALLTAVSEKLAAENQWSRKEKTRDCFTPAGLVALCLTFEALSLQRDPPLVALCSLQGGAQWSFPPTVVEQLLRAVGASSGEFSELERPVVVRCLSRLGWLPLLADSDRQALMEPVT